MHQAQTTWTCIEEQSNYIGPSGLFGVWGRPGHVRSSALSHDPDLARRLWQVSERLTGVRYRTLDERAAGASMR